MPGLVPSIHVFGSYREVKTWMVGTSPAMTGYRLLAINSFMISFVPA
jgi:hypothetical protein